MYVKGSISSSWHLFSAGKAFRAHLKSVESYTRPKHEMDDYNPKSTNIKFLVFEATVTEDT